MVDRLQDILIVLIPTLLASSGFWSYVLHRDKTKQTLARLIMGLAYDKLMTVGVSYIERGWITKDEYEDYRKYLYDPYKALGGNGVAERIMEEVSKLPIRSYDRYAQLIKPSFVKEENHDESRKAS
jgi:hypothetical protein